MTPNLCVVLYKPLNDLNIGSVLRVLSNFGVQNLRIVSHRDIDPETVRVTATRSFERFDSVTTFATLEDAVADCQCVFATTSRARTANETIYTPSSAAQFSLASLAKGETVALLFGPEDHGLPNDALDHATAVITIPTEPGYASLNLAQAVLLVVWEVFRVQLDEVADAGFADAVGPTDTAELGQVDRMIDSAQDALHAIGFFKYDNDTHIMRGLRKVFSRARLSRRELAIFFGIFAEIKHFVRQCRSRDE